MIFTIESVIWPVGILEHLQFVIDFMWIIGHTTLVVGDCFS